MPFHFQTPQCQGEVEVPDGAIVRGVEAMRVQPYYEWLLVVHWQRGDEYGQSSCILPDAGLYRRHALPTPPITFDLLPGQLSINNINQQLIPDEQFRAMLFGNLADAPGDENVLPPDQSLIDEMHSLYLSDEDRHNLTHSVPIIVASRIIRGGKYRIVGDNRPVLSIGRKKWFCCLEPECDPREKVLTRLMLLRWDEETFIRKANVSRHEEYYPFEPMGYVLRDYLPEGLAIPEIPEIRPVVGEGAYQIFANQGRESMQTLFRSVRAVSAST